MHKREGQIEFSSVKSVPAAASGAMPPQVASVCKCFDMILDRVAVGASGFHCFGHGDAPATAAQLQNLYREFRQVAEK